MWLLSVPDVNLPCFDLVQSSCFFWQSLTEQGVKDIPLLVIESEQWYKWDEHHDSMKRKSILTHMFSLFKLHSLLCSELMSACGHQQNVFTVVRTSRHSNFSDLAMFSPVILLCFALIFFKISPLLSQLVDCKKIEADWQNWFEAWLSYLQRAQRSVFAARYSLFSS